MGLFRAVGIVAEYSDYVIAADIDLLAVKKHYQRLERQDVKNILSLVLNVVDPSPNIGWRGLERRGITSRGKPEIVLCLALIHHIVIVACALMEFINWLSNSASSAASVSCFTKGAKTPS